MRLPARRVLTRVSRVLVLCTQGEDCPTYPAEATTALGHTELRPDACPFCGAEDGQEIVG